jgi:ribonuclease HII
MFVIGTDEAGYGPNLGPLVISATVWRVDDALVDADWYELLGDCLSPQRVTTAETRAPIADSKALYSAGGSWEQLELGLLAALHVCARPCHSWSTLWQSLAEAQLAQLAAQPWHKNIELTTPVAACSQRIAEFGAAWKQRQMRGDVQLLAIRARPVFPTEFNQRLQGCNKSTLLSQVTLQLAAELVAEHCAGERVLIHGDKHGGRNAYAALLADTFPNAFFTVVSEGRAESRYRTAGSGPQMEARFVAKGERFVPAALASMACKYLRELSMQAFNTFWQAHVPHLKPTAGYPEDAQRFQRDIAAAQRKLGIATETLWRNK